MKESIRAEVQLGIMEAFVVVVLALFVVAPLVGIVVGMTTSSSRVSWWTAGGSPSQIAAEAAAISLVMVAAAALVVLVYAADKGLDAVRFRAIAACWAIGLAAIVIAATFVVAAFRLWPDGNPIGVGWVALVAVAAFVLLHALTEAYLLCRRSAAAEQPIDNDRVTDPGSVSARPTSPS